MQAPRIVVCAKDVHVKGGSDMDKQQKQEEQLSRETLKRRAELDELLSTTFNSILRVEEQSLDNRVTRGLSITEIHTIIAVGLHESNPMSIVAARLNITLATLTIAVNKLEGKGFIEKERSQTDRRKVMIRLTKEGRQVYRVHDMFHKNMITEALADLTEQEEIVLSKALSKVKQFFENQSTSHECSSQK